MSQFYVIKLSDTIIYCKYYDVGCTYIVLSCYTREKNNCWLHTYYIRLYRNIIPRNIIITTTLLLLPTTTVYYRHHYYYYILLLLLLLLMLLLLLLLLLCVSISYYTRHADTVVTRRVVIGRRVFADRDHFGRRVGWRRRRHGMTSTPSPSIHRQTRSTTRTRPPADTAP